MIMISFTYKGNFNNIEDFFKRTTGKKYMYIFERYANEGLAALSSATPINTGLTAMSWEYRIEKTKNSIKIIWFNSNIVDGVPIAVVIQYGHGTRNGGYVEGIDYINPALKPVFDKLTQDLWAEVTK